MSANVEANMAKGSLVYLDPNDIMEPESTNVRQFTTKSGESDLEIEELTALGLSLAKKQIQPVCVMLVEDAKEGEPRYAIIAGRRRRKAALMYNMGLGEGQAPIKLAAIVSAKEKEGRLFQIAAHENILRRNISPMDFALNIKTAREKIKGTDKIAAFFGVSPAQITQHEKLLTLPDELQGRVGSGELSKDDAFKLAEIAKVEGGEKAREVADQALAAEKSVLDSAVQGDVLGEVEGSVVGELAGEIRSDDDSAVGAIGAGASKSGKKKGGAVKKKAAAARTSVISKAAREAAEKSDKTKVIPRKKKEILEFFESCLGPVYGHANGAVHGFVGVLLDYAAGKVTDKKLQNAFDRLALVDGVDKGTPAKVVKPAMEGMDAMLKTNGPMKGSIAAVAAEKKSAGKAKTKAKAKK